MQRFNLAKNDIQDLTIRLPHTEYEATCIMECKKTNKKFDGFVLYDGDKVKTVCDVKFFKGSTGKYKPRFTFKKINNDEPTKSKGEDVIIDISTTEKGLDEFWKMINFLQQFKEVVETGEFKNSFSHVEKLSIEVYKKISSLKNKNEVLESLSKLGSQDLENIQYLAGIANITNVLTKWEELEESQVREEKEWENLFNENRWVLEQVFCSSFEFLHKQFNCGGQKTNLKGGG